MIVINKNSDNNKIALSLRQSQTAESSNFLFVFTNDFTKQSFTANLEDVSTFKERSNIFCIDGSLFDAVQSGSWHYRVYQNPDDASEIDGLKCVGADLMILTENAEPTKAYNSERKINSVYGEE
jgi:hypothetical protein